MSNDEAWLAKVEAGDPHGEFGHREHLRLAWLVLAREADLAAATGRVSQTIYRLAVRHGRPQRYNQTVTDAWVRIVAHCRDQQPSADFDDMLRDRRWLFDKRLLLRHYSSRVLASDIARRQWVEPDLQAIPV